MKRRPHFRIEFTRTGHYAVRVDESVVARLLAHLSRRRPSAEPIRRRPAVHADIVDAKKHPPLMSPRRYEVLCDPYFRGRP